MVSSNAQLVDLGLLSEATDTLNRRWINCSKKLPITRYVYGSHDTIVDKKAHYRWIVNEITQLQLMKGIAQFASPKTARLQCLLR